MAAQTTLLDARIIGGHVPVKAHGRSTSSSKGTSR